MYKNSKYYRPHMDAVVEGTRAAKIVQEIGIEVSQAPEFRKWPNPVFQVGSKTYQILPRGTYENKYSNN